MTQPLNDYFEALERIKNDTPNIVAKGIKITNDAVALEAGRQKGSIKKSRAVFYELIEAIEKSALEQAQNNKSDDKLKKAKDEVAQYKQSWEASLAREVSLLNEIFELKKQLATFNGSNVFPIKK